MFGYPIQQPNRVNGEAPAGTAVPLQYIPQFVPQHPSMAVQFSMAPVATQLPSTNLYSHGMLRDPAGQADSPAGSYVGASPPWASGVPASFFLNTAAAPQILTEENSSTGSRTAIEDARASSSERRPRSRLSNRDSSPPVRQRDSSPSGSDGEPDGSYYENLRRYLRELNGAELREIILSVCVEQPGTYEGVANYVKRKEKAEKIKVTHYTDGLGQHLQFFNAVDLEAIIFYICEKSQSPNTKNIIKHLVSTIRGGHRTGRTHSWSD